MPAASATPPSRQPTQSLKQRVLIYLTKLSDRDTHAIAASELDCIARSLDPASFSVFLSCIQSTDAADKSQVRKQCVNLIATLSLSHGNSLSPYLAKMLTAVTRRLRDPDSAVRSACVCTASALASNVTRPSFDSFVKAFTDALFTEQDVNAQMGAALCLASAIDAAPNPDPAKLTRLMPKFEKLLKSDGFKAKGGVLVLIGSVVAVGGAGSVGALKNLVPCLMGFLSSEDWSSRKAAAEVLLKLAVVERDSLVEYKSDCLKIFESRRYDKVKAVRDAMNQMLEAWKQVPDVSDEISPPIPSASSSRENASEMQNPQGTRKRVPLKIGDRNTTPSGIISKADPKKLSNWNVEISISNSSLAENNGEICSGATRMHKGGGFRSGSRVAPWNEESVESNSDQYHDLHRNHKGCEDLTLIKGQLAEIEKQQSSLLDLLQKFMGSSSSGMRSLETLVHGLELTIDEISYDLAVTSGRMSRHDSATTTCRMLPRDFWSSRFRRRQQHGRQFTTSSELGNFESRRSKQHGRAGFVVNPLAKIHGGSKADL